MAESIERDQAHEVNHEMVGVPVAGLSLSTIQYLSLSGFLSAATVVSFAVEKHQACLLIFEVYWLLGTY